MTEAEYHEARAEVSRILKATPDPAVDSPEGKRIVELVRQLVAYEAEHFPGFGGNRKEQSMDNEDELDAMEAIWLNQFIGENWQRFLNFMEERDGEEAADKLAAKLEKLGQR